MAYDGVARERCLKCGNHTFSNNFLLKEGRHARVFVECAKCGELVARYILHAYVDPNYSFPTVLRMLHRTSNYGDSLGDIKEDLQTHQERAKTQFSDLKKRLHQTPSEEDTRRLAEIILDEGILEDE